MPVRCGGRFGDIREVERSEAEKQEIRKSLLLVSLLLASLEFRMIKNAVGLFVLTIIVLVIFLPSYTKMQDFSRADLILKSLNQINVKKILDMDKI